MSIKHVNPVEIMFLDRMIKGDKGDKGDAGADGDASGSLLNHESIYDHGDLHEHANKGVLDQLGLLDGILTVNGVKITDYLTNVFPSYIPVATLVENIVLDGQGEGTRIGQTPVITAEAGHNIIIQYIFNATVEALFSGYSVKLHKSTGDSWDIAGGSALEGATIATSSTIIDSSGESGYYYFKAMMSPDFVRDFAGTITKAQTVISAA